MNKYAGISCPVCGKEFTDSDDIVVCPDCGAPHHRDCYQELGSCVFSSRHEPDFAWKGPAEPSGAAPSLGGQPVPRQNAQPIFPPPVPGTPPPPDYRSSFGGGQQGGAKGGPFGNMPNAQELPGLRLDECIDGIPIKDLAQFIGPNAYYYLLRFKALAAQGQSVLVSFSAFFFGFLYYFYRKMYKWGAVMLGLLLLCILPSLIFTYQIFPHVVTYMISVVSGGVPDATALNAAVAAQSGLSMLGLVGRWAYFGVSFVSGLLANKLYFAHVKQSISSLRGHLSGRPDQELSHALAIQGRTNIFAVVGVIGLLVLAYFGYVAFLMVAYQNILF